MDETAAERPTAIMHRHGLLAGVIAALLMTVAMATLRYTTGVPSLPEIIADAMIGLMPATLFSAILDVMQKAAKPTMYAGILVGMVAVGGLLGRGFAYGPLTWRRAGTLALVIWGLFGVVILPLLRVGLFGSLSDVRVGLLPAALQLAVVIGSFAASLLLILRATEPASDAPALRVQRRTALAGIMGGMVAIAAGGSVWRMLLSGPAPTSTADTGAGSAGAGSTSAPAATSANAPTVANRGVPRIDAPAIPMTIQPGQPAPAPFDVPRLAKEVLDAREFYTVSKNLIDPSVEQASWSLTIDGLVERPATYVYTDLASLPQYSDYYTLQCVSNPVGGDLWGNAHWQGVRLVELLGRAGLKAGIRKVVFHAADGYTDSITLDSALRADALLAYQMNGEPLTKEHGFPARLLIPGIYGMKNVKWITRIELVDYDFKGYWATRGWDDAAPYHTSTRIDTPITRAQVEAGDTVIAGVSFAGFRGIDRVEVSLDNGQTWEPAQIKPSLSQNAWNLWVLQHKVEPGTYQIKARAIDGTGELQTPLEAEPVPDGATGYHTVILRVG